MNAIVASSLLLVCGFAHAMGQNRVSSASDAKHTIHPAGPTALLESARQSSDRGDYAKALASLKTALEAAPNSTELLYQYGLIAVRLSKPVETIRVMSAATRLEADNSDYLFLLGVAQLWAEDFENAAVPLGRASELSPDSARTNLAYGAALYSLKRYEEATTHLQHALALDPKSSEALYLMADIDQVKGDSANAERLAGSVLSREPNHPGANFVRGVVLFKKGDLVGSLKSLQLAIASDPGNPRIYSQLSEVYTRMGNPSKAAEAKRKSETTTRRSNFSDRELRALLGFIIAPGPKPALKRTSDPK